MLKAAKSSGETIPETCRMQCGLERHEKDWIE